MLYVDETRCSGCGACVDVCPGGAIALRQGTAIIHQERCSQCEACFHACPEQAILSVSERGLVPQHQRAGAVALSAAPRAGSLAARAAPALAATLLFVGRELIPRAANYVLDMVDRRMSTSSAGGVQEAASASDQSSGSESGGRRRRRHRRG
ncbi:MAG: 4Fe-4S binding protein [Anaerolineae bacterium]